MADKTFWILAKVAKSISEASAKDTRSTSEADAKEQSAESTPETNALSKSALANGADQRSEQIVSAAVTGSSGPLETTEQAELGANENISAEDSGNQEIPQLGEFYKALEILETEVGAEPDSLEDINRLKLEEAAALFQPQSNQAAYKHYEKSSMRDGTWKSMWKKRRAEVRKPSGNEVTTQASREKLQLMLSQGVCAVALLCGIAVAIFPNGNGEKTPSRKSPADIVNGATVTKTPDKSSQSAQIETKLAPGSEAGTNHLTRAKHALSETEKLALAEKKFISQTKQLDLATLKKNGYEYIRKGDGSHAVLMLSQAVKRRPDDGEARKYLAYALIAANNPVDALAQYLASQKLHSDSAGEQISFATALAHSSNQEPAETYFDELVTNFSDDSEKLWMIEKKCESLGLISQASNAALLAGVVHSKHSQKHSVKISQANEN